MASAGDRLELLCSKTKLERDRGLNELEKYLSTTATAKDIVDLTYCNLAILENKDNPWETKFGALIAAQCLIGYVDLEHPSSEHFARKIQLISLHNLTDTEVRVRQASGIVLGALCRRLGPQVYVDVKDEIMQLIQSSLERQCLEDNAAAQAEQLEVGKLMDKFASTGQKRCSTAEELFHDTAGWKSLETSMTALQAMVEGCGRAFQPYINQDLLDLIFQALSHTNRFVRETGYFVCGALVNCGQQDADSQDMDVNSSSIESNPMFAYGHQLCQFLGKGMSDNWSQVRMAASMATRKFLLSFSCEKDREVYYPELLPKMCLNRYYLADGVRIYAQETWRQIAGSQGRELVEKYISDVVCFYLSQIQADNHAVREASCSCIAELAAKMKKEIMQPYVPQLLGTLLVCFKDESWPVRDAACLASGNFIVCFPEESRGAVAELFPLFFQNLEDNIPSVRQGAAVSLANTVRAYGEEALAVIIPKLQEGFKCIQDQPSESEKYVELNKGPATFGIVKRLRDNDMELHTNQTMYSCGSLAPKLSRGRLCGCLERAIRRPVQPWERTEGCIYLMAELANVASAILSVSQQLPLMAEAATKRHYTHHVVLLETLCSQLPGLAKGLGKKNFKPHLELFFEPVFYSLKCENALTSSAASYCLNQLGAWLGPNIFRGRVEQHSPEYLPLLDANTHIAPL